MRLSVDDPVNFSIWKQSVELQRRIAARETQPLRTGAQQAMPKACDVKRFSPQEPLPWVPDLVGTNFGTDPKSVLVVASSYNGFIEGYSGRKAVMPLLDYVDAKNDASHGLERFCRAFVKHVVDCDAEYYQPILRDLLPSAECDSDCCCLTDLCKASFVERGAGPDSGNRGDKGDDSVVRKFWRQWIVYVSGVADGECAAPLPYQWLWQRMQQCRVVVALGTIAEYGVLKVFQRMATAPRAWSWKEDAVAPDHLTMTNRTSDWEYAYACSKRTLAKWLTGEDWWVLGDAEMRARWFLLPVHHPASAVGRGNDPRYQQTAPNLRRLIAAAVDRLPGLIGSEHAQRHS